MNQNTFVNIGRELFLTLIAFDRASCSRPRSKYLYCQEFLLSTEAAWCEFWANKKVKWWLVPVYLRPCWTPSCSSWPAPPPPPSSSSPSTNSHWTRTHIHCHRIESLIFILCYALAWGFRCFSNLCHECQSQLLFLILPKIYTTTKVFHLKYPEMNYCHVKRSTKLHTFASTSSVSLKISPVNPDGTAVRKAGS